ncbi:MAG: aldo/keto reductase, partial [Alphaproteobacteria bacterium]|nr:aldo/keto reductase [Alphaproteobacteria bacterium]
YNLGRRGIEAGLLPWSRRHAMPIMAYTPLEPAAGRAHPVLAKIAAARGVSPAQIALAWVLAQDGVLTIPKAGNAAHLRENRAALDIALTREEKAALDAAFPPPKRKVPLEML